MITEFLLNIVFGIVSGILTVIPDVSWSVDSTAFTYFLDVIRVAGYMLPLGTCSAIIIITVALINLRIGISLIKTIWDLLPIV